MINLKNKIILNKLTINNFATFNSQTICFCDGFNAIIGETGSGKSLLLDALQLIFGGRADKRIVRQGASFAVVEATFTTADNSILNYFEEIGYPTHENEVVIKRLVYDTGKSKSYLNFQSATLTTLSKTTRRFVDLVGQFENQKLLSSKYQLVLLDSFAKTNNKVINYHKTYSEITQLETEIQNLEKTQVELEQKKDYISFQLSEISKLDPSTEDEAQLLEHKNKLLIIQSELESIIKANNYLSESESTPSAIEQLKNTIKTLSRSENASINAEISNLQNALALVEDSAFNLSKFTEQEFDPNKLEQIIDRLDKYQTIKRKFGGTTESVMEYYNSFQTEINSISKIDDDLKDKKATLLSLTSMANKLATDLHNIRIKNAKKLSTLLTESVQKLRMTGAKIDLSVEKNDSLGPTGISNIAFNAQTNPGEGSHKLSDIASGGELSRILLATRQILSVHDSISLFLFDEIDTGIGGKTASTIGKVLKDVSNDSQVIAITHLPQIAINADKLIEVTKSSTTNNDSKIRTVSNVHEHVGANVKKQAEIMASL